MKKNLEEVADKLLQAVAEPLIEIGFKSRPHQYENDGLDYRVLLITDAKGEEDVAIDAHDININGREHILLQYKCVLISNIEEELLPELKIWQERANILMPLGSLVLLNQDLMLRYSMLCPAENLPEQSLLNAATELFFMERVFYTKIGVDLLIGENTLEEAMTRLLTEKAGIDD